MGPVYFGDANKAVAILDGWSCAALWLRGLAVVFAALAARPVFDAFGTAAFVP